MGWQETAARIAKKVPTWLGGNWLYNWLITQGRGASTAKLVGGVVSSVAVALWGAVEHLRPPEIALLGLLIFVGVIWAINGVLYMTEQRQRRRLFRENSVESKVPTEKRLPQATKTELDQPYIRGRFLRLVDVPTDSRGFVVGRTFEECQLAGPAVIAPFGSGLMTGNHLYAPVDATFWERRGLTAGALGMENCNFLRCHMAGIGIVGPPEEVERWKKGSHE